MILIEYIKKYKVTYISVIVTFLIGTLLGIFVTFKMPEKERNDVAEYINETVQVIRDGKVDKQSLFKEKLIENLKDTGIVWVLGCTIIASFTIYIFMIYKGILFGYIIAVVWLTLGFGNGLKFLTPSIIGNNLIFLPMLFLLSTSGIRLYKEIIKRKINIKQELLRHTIIMIISCIFAIIVSYVDSYILTSLLYFL